MIKLSEVEKIVSNGLAKDKNKAIIPTRAF